MSILTCGQLSAFGEEADISNISALERRRNTAVGRQTEASSTVIPIIQRPAVRRGYDGGLPCYFRIGVQPNYFRAFRLNDGGRTDYILAVPQWRSMGMESAVDFSHQ